MPAGLNVKAFQEWLASGDPSVVNGRKWTYSAEDQNGKWGASVAAAWKSWSDNVFNKL